MGITMKNPKEFERELEKRVNRIEDVILRHLDKLGEEAVNYARLNGSYKDHTGNLRSSVGYLLVDHGIIVKQGGFSGTSEGSRKGQSYADSLARGIQGFGIIVVAGMDYAFFVETNGYDVLTGAEKTTRRELGRMKKDIINQLSKIKW